MARRPTKLPEPPPHPFSRPFDPVAFEAGLRSLAGRPAFHFPREAVPDHFNRSSVLVCFWREGRREGRREEGGEGTREGRREARHESGEIRVLLTKRAATLRGHPGQMSFPGGRLEAGEDWTTAALREAEEEVALSRDRVEVLGRLDDAWSGAGHLLVPIVGWLDRPPALRANPDEVESIHTPSIADFFRDDAYSVESREIAGFRYFNPTLRWEGASVYGLSADLLIEAIQFALGHEAPHGPGRLANLESYFKDEAET